MIDIMAILYKLVKILRVMCAGYQVADAVMNLSKMVGKLDDLERQMQRLSETVKESAYEYEGELASQPRAGGL